MSPRGPSLGETDAVVGRQNKPECLGNGKRGVFALVGRGSSGSRSPALPLCDLINPGSWETKTNASVSFLGCLFGSWESKVGD